jgi:hypothetical protein
MWKSSQPIEFESSLGMAAITESFIPSRALSTMPQFRSKAVSPVSDADIDLSPNVKYYWVLNYIGLGLLSNDNGWLGIGCFCS